MSDLRKQFNDVGAGQPDDHLDEMVRIAQAYADQQVREAVDNHSFVAINEIRAKLELTHAQELRVRKAFAKADAALDKRTDTP